MRYAALPLWSRVPGARGVRFFVVGLCRGIFIWESDTVRPIGALMIKIIKLFNWHCLGSLAQVVKVVVKVVGEVKVVGVGVDMLVLGQGVDADWFNFEQGNPFKPFFSVVSESRKYDVCGT